MAKVSVVEVRPGLRVRDKTTGKEGAIIPPPKGAWVGLGRTWVDLGGGPEQIEEANLDVVAQAVRLTVKHNPANPVDDLKKIAEVKRDLQAHSSVEVDSENPFYRTRRDANKNAFFEFVTEYPDEVGRVLREYGHENRVTMEVVLSEVGLECVRCGFFAGFVTECPNCGLRDISQCPKCDREIPREKYEHVSSDLFVCPHCRQRVRLQINPFLVDEDGTYHEPVVLVKDAQE